MIGFVLTRVAADLARGVGRLDCRRVALLASIFFHAAPVMAAPDFSRTEITISPDAPLEADVVTFTMVLRNSGPDDAESVYVSAEWPLMGFLVDASGFEGAEVDHEARTLTVMVPLPAGNERRFAVRILAPRDSGGDALTLALRASHFASSTEYRDSRTVVIDTRLADGGVSLGGVRVTTAGLVVLGVLAGGVLLWIAVRVTARPNRAGSESSLLKQMIGPGPAAAAVTIAVGFWILFATMAWRDYQSLTKWTETTCTVLGGRLSAQPTTVTRRAASGQSTDQTNYVPVLGLRYDAAGREMLSSGYDTGSRLGIGGRGGRTEELGQWTVGGTTPCWYDPTNPMDVVVLRGFGGAYLFALFPLPVFLLGTSRIRQMVARGR